MAHVYDGAPDARQETAAPNPASIPSRFRPRYRQLTAAEMSLHDAIKWKASELEALFEKVLPGREADIAMERLEEAVMWIIKAHTRP